MLRNKADYCSQAKGNENYQSPANPTGRNNRGLTKSVSVSQFFPMASNYVGRNTAVAAGQISGSNQSLSDEARFWQVLGFSSIGHETRVAGGGRSGKGSDYSLFGFQGEGVLGINSFDGTPIQANFPEDVVDQDAGFRNPNAWIPKQQPSEERKPQVNPYFGQEHLQGFGCQSEYPNSCESNCEGSHNFAGSGSHGLGIHVASLTQSTFERGF